MGVQAREMDSGRGRGEGSKESIRIARDAFCAFSLGTRGCVGRSVAYLELALELARCLWLFDIRQAEGGESGGSHATELQKWEERWGDTGKVSSNWWIDSWLREVGQR